MTRDDRAATPRVEANDVALVQRMVALIGKSYADRITLKTVSAAIPGVPHTLGQLFRKTVGVSFHEHLTRTRLGHAVLLIAAGVKIEAVALGVGYRSKKNFYRQFTRLFGATPQKFRGRSIANPPFYAPPTASIRFASSVAGARGHVCAFFRNRQEEYRVLLPFIKEGFARGERVMHVVDPSRLDDHVRRLEAAGIPVVAARESGQFALCDWNEPYRPDGSFDQDRMLTLWKGLIEAAEVTGLPRSRLIAHMEWSLEDRSGVADVLEYEARYNLVHDDRDTVICVYDLTKYNGAMLMDVLRSHPAIIVDGVLQDNLLYLPPELFLEELRARPKGVMP